MFASNWPSEPLSASNASTMVRLTSSISCSVDANWCIMGHESFCRPMALACDAQSRTNVASAASRSAARYCASTYAVDSRRSRASPA